MVVGVGVGVVVVGDVVVEVVVLVGVVVDGVVVVEVGVLVGRGALEVVGRAASVGLPRGAGSTRSEGFSAIVRGTGSLPGLLAVGIAVVPAPSFPLDPVRAKAPPRKIAATASAPTAATVRLRRSRCAPAGAVARDRSVGADSGRVFGRVVTGRRIVGAYGAGSYRRAAVGY